MTPIRYHVSLRVLHWLIAVMLVAMLFTGTFVLGETLNADPNKLSVLRMHMIGGGLVLVLTLLRLFFRMKTAHPAPLLTGNVWADRLAPSVHWLLYVLVLVMAGSGMGIALQAGLPVILFAGQGSLPQDFNDLLPRSVHGAIATVLFLFIALHVAAALYHQFIKKDGLLARMGFGK